MGAVVIHDSFHIDVRARLQFMRDNPTEAAISREALLAQVATWLLVGGLDPVTIEKKFYPDKLANMGDVLSRPVDAEWAGTVIDRALGLLPRGCVMKISRDRSKEAS
jgi:hypothetical protein